MLLHTNKYFQVIFISWVGIAQSVWRLATSWTVRGSNLGRGEIFRTRLDRPYGPLTMGTGSFPGVKRPGLGVDHPPASTAEVKERIQPYLYSPLSVLGLF